MTRDISSQYDLENPVVELKFQSDLSKIVNITTLLPLRKKPRQSRFWWEGSIFLLSLIGFPFSTRWPLAVIFPYQSRVDDFRFMLMACFEDARRAKARSVYYKYTVTGNSETHFGDIKTVSLKERNQANPTKSGSKAPGATAITGSQRSFCSRNNHSNPDCRTRTSEFTNNQNRPYIGSEAHSQSRWRQRMDSQLQRNWSTDE